MTASSAKPKSIVMNVDYFDELELHEQPMGPEDVEELVRQCAKSSVDTISWRATGLGLAGYPSRVVPPASWAATQEFRRLMDRMPPRGREENWHETFWCATADRWTRRLPGSLARMDPIATARDACRRHGLKFFIWFDIVDEMCSQYLLEHPQCLVLGRDGTPWSGLRSYSNPAAVANQLEVIDELVAYRPDGIYLSTSCHTRHNSFPEPADFYGYEPAVAKAYAKRVGRDIHEGDLDAVAWHDIKGGFYTEFYRQVKARLAAIGAQLAIGTQYGKYTIFASPYSSTHVPYRFTTQWKRWIDEGIADILVLGDYEWTWDRVGLWEEKGIDIPAGKQVSDVMLPQYVQYAAGRTKCYVFSSWLSAYPKQQKDASADNLADAMRMRARTLRETGADGICLHEAHTFEHYKGFDTVVEMRAMLGGQTPVGAVGASHR